MYRPEKSLPQKSKLLWKLNAIGRCGATDRGMARGELRSTPELSVPLPQFVTTSMKGDGSKNPQSTPEKFNVKGDGSRKAGFAHVNQTTGAKTHELHPCSSM